MASITLQIPAGNRTWLQVASTALVAIDMLLVRSGRLPRLYEAGVRYRREHPDVWNPANVVLARGWGDCEDLAAWRVAELRESGEDGDAVMDFQTQGIAGRWHAVVRRGDGTVEDPSRVLGMGRKVRR